MHSESKLQVLISEQIQTAWNFITSEKATIGVMYLIYQYVKSMWLIQKISCSLHLKANNCSSLFGCNLAIFILNSSHDALTIFDIHRTKIVSYEYGIHDIGTV